MKTKSSSALIISIYSLIMQNRIHLERGIEHLAVRGRYQILLGAIHKVYKKGAKLNSGALMTETLQNAHKNEVISDFLCETKVGGVDRLLCGPPNTYLFNGMTTYKHLILPTI